MALFGAPRTKTGWACIRLGAGQVDLAHVAVERDGKPAVQICDSYRIEGGPVATLARLRREVKLKDYRCVALLEPGQYRLVQVDTPKVPGTELKAALRWQVKDLVDFPMESAVVDVLPLPLPVAVQGGAAQKHFVAAAPKERIAALMRAFDDAGVPLQAIDIPETAQRNAARLLETPGRALALLVFDAEDPLLTFTAGGELYQHRRIELQARVDGIDDAGQRRAFYERLVLELQRSLDQFGRQYPALAISRMLVSSVSGADDLVPQLAGGLALPVAALDLTRVVDCTRVPELAAPGRQTQCLHLLGAALREATANAAVQPLRRAS